MLNDASFLKENISKNNLFLMKFTSFDIYVPASHQCNELFFEI